MTRKELLIQEAARYIGRSQRQILVEQEGDRQSWNKKTLEYLHTPSGRDNTSPHAAYMQMADRLSNGWPHPASELVPYKQHIIDAVTKATPAIVDHAYDHWPESHKNFPPTEASEGKKEDYRRAQASKITQVAFRLADKHLPEGLPSHVRDKAAQMLVGISTHIAGVVPEAKD